MEQSVKIQGRNFLIQKRISNELYITKDTCANVNYLLKYVVDPIDSRLRNIQNESNLLKELCPHPNIIGFVTSKLTKAACYVVYDLCTGPSLNDTIPSDPLSPVYQIALALKHMHTRFIPIIHRNLTPHTVYEDKGTYKITGLESSCFQYSNLIEADIPIENTFEQEDKWKAPELLEQHENLIVDCKIDSWNLGMILYFMAFHILPFPDTYSQKQGAYTLPRETTWKIKDLLGMMLNPNPLERADMDVILSKLNEQVPGIPGNCSFRHSCFWKFFSMRSSNSTASLVDELHSPQAVIPSVNIDKLLGKVWRTPGKSTKFFAHILRLKGLSNPQVRLKVCLLLFHYLQSSPLIVYHSSPGTTEVINYIESYCSVKPGHPLKTDHFRRLTNMITATLKGKYYINKANTDLFNGKFNLHEGSSLNVTQEQCASLLECLITYWSTAVKAHELLAQRDQLADTRLSLRNILISEQSSLITIIRVLYEKLDNTEEVNSAMNEYMKLYHRAKSLFQLDSQVLPTGLVLCQSIPEILIEDPILENPSELAASQEDCKLPHLELPVPLEIIVIRPLEIQSSPLDQYSIRFSELQKLRTIVKGNSSEVWLGLYQKTYVAIKQLKLFDESYLNEFQREFSVLTKLRHPNLVLLMGAHLSEPLCFIMEFCGGGDLFHLLHERKETVLSWEQKLKILKDIARGMHFLHYNSFMHKDLKSLNLLLASPVVKPSDPIVMRISDFGLSKVVLEGAAMTGNWMAPEILDGKQYTFKADVYSFAMIIYEVLARELPYRGYSVEEIRNRVLNYEERPDLTLVPTECPRSILNLMKLCWNTDPVKRPGFSNIVDILNSITVPQTI